MINIKKDYKHLSKSQIAHYYFLKNLFNNPPPIVVPTMQEIEKDAAKREEEYKIELQQQEIEDRNKTAEELADEAIESVKNYWHKLENGCWPKEIET